MKTSDAHRLFLSFPHQAVIGLGANLGNAAATLMAAWQVIGALSGIACQCLSSPYRSRPLDMDSDHFFVNAVGLLFTSLPPLELLHQLQSVEHQFGRVRDPQKSGYQDRTLDLDLLLFDTRRMHLPELIIPHPRMGERRFVLEPLAECAEEITLSPFGVPVSTWARERLSLVREQEVRRGSWPAEGAGVC